MTIWNVRECRIVVVVSECEVTHFNDSHVNYSTGDTENYPGTLSVTCDKGYKVNGSDTNDDITVILECLDTGVFNHTPVCEPKGKTLFKQNCKNGILLDTYLPTIVANLLHICLH